MDFVETYYTDVVGCYPHADNTNREKSQAIIDYLLEAGMDESEVLRFVEEAPAADCLHPGLLPEWMWENQLTKKGAFYFHNTLHVHSPAPLWNPRTGRETFGKFYLEMKIKYGMIDLIRYFYRTLSVPRELMDEKRDSASFQYMLNRYERFSSRYEALDFVLGLIDYGKHMDEDEMSISGVLDIKRYEASVLEIFEEKAGAAELACANVTIWR